MNREIYSGENEGGKPQTNEPPKGNPHPLGQGGGQLDKIESLSSAS
jgi:hypothetical protein